MEKGNNTLIAVRTACAIAMAALATTAAAQALSVRGAFVQGGAADHDARSLGVGVIGGAAWQRDQSIGRLSLHGEAYVARWGADLPAGGHRDYWQLVAIPVLRLQFGASPFFAEAGIGLSYMDRLYRTPGKQFSTRLNFADVLAAGYAFGAQRESELSLRLSHFSNAGIRQPNPGENLYQLRYTRRF